LGSTAACDGFLGCPSVVAVESRPFGKPPLLFLLLSPGYYPLMARDVEPRRQPAKAGDKVEYERRLDLVAVCLWSVPHHHGGGRRSCCAVLVQPDLEESSGRVSWSRNGTPWATSLIVQVSGWGSPSR